MSKRLDERRDEDDPKPDPDSNVGYWLMGGFAALLVFAIVYGILTNR